MKSFMAKKEQVEQKWVLVDAEGAILGRMAAKIAPILMGKHKPTYTPHVDTGDYVVVVNAEKIQLTGKKAQTKEYDYYTHFPGGHKYVSFADMIARKPERVIELAGAVAKQEQLFAYCITDSSNNGVDGQCNLDYPGTDKIDGSFEWRR